MPAHAAIRRRNATLQPVWEIENLQDGNWQYVGSERAGSATEAVAVYRHHHAEWSKGRKFRAKRRNPSRRNLNAVQRAGQSALKVYDRAGSYVGTVLKSAARLPREWAGSLVGERNARRSLMSRLNPEQAPGDLYESFHGKPADKVTLVREEIEMATDLEPLGVLVNYRVATLTGLDAFLGTPDAEAERMEFDETTADAESVILASNRAGTQLYFVGGDQSLPLDKLKFTGDLVKDDMIIGVLYEVTYRTKKKFDKFELTDYYHHLGEESGDQPMLRYDSLSPHLHVSGGKYKIKVPLVGMSPGIEN